MAIVYEELTRRNVAGLLPADDPGQRASTRAGAAAPGAIRLHGEIKIRHSNSLLDPQRRGDYVGSAAPPPQPGA
jgi:hypothetical protein